MTGRYGDIDYPTYAKLGFLAGLLLFAIGAFGEVGGRAFYGTLPAWENALLFDMEILGIFVVVLAPLFFGIILPLTE